VKPLWRTDLASDLQPGSRWLHACRASLANKGIYRVA
jgi:hypothetical protein